MAAVPTKSVNLIMPNAKSFLKMLGIMRFTLLWVPQPLITHPTSGGSQNRTLNVSCPDYYWLQEPTQLLLYEVLASHKERTKVEWKMRFQLVCFACLLVAVANSVLTGQASENRILPLFL